MGKFLYPNLNSRQTRIVRISQEIHYWLRIEAAKQRTTIKGLLEQAVEALKQRKGASNEENY